MNAFSSAAFSIGPFAVTFIYAKSCSDFRQLRLAGSIRAEELDGFGVVHAGVEREVMAARREDDLVCLDGQG